MATLFCPCKMLMNTFYKKTPLLKIWGHPVNVANGQIQKSQQVYSF